MLRSSPSEYAFIDVWSSFETRASALLRTKLIDAWIDPAARIPNMFRLMQIEEEISRDLGVPVTITTRNALHPLMKDAIERDAIRVL